MNKYAGGELENERQLGQSQSRQLEIMTPIATATPEQLAPRAKKTASRPAFRP